MSSSKKLFASLISLAALLVSVGCSNNSGPNIKNSSSSNQTHFDNTSSSSRSSKNDGASVSSNTSTSKNGTSAPQSSSSKNNSTSNGGQSSSNQGSSNNHGFSSNGSSSSQGGGNTNPEIVPEGKEVSPIATNLDEAPIDHPENSTPHAMPELIPHEPIVKSISATGGELGEEDENLSISFPAGALKQAKEITATYIDESSFINDRPLMNFMGAVEFGPSGTTFDEDVQVTMKLSRKTENYEPKLSVFCYDETNDIWDFVSEASYSNSTKEATFTVRHFSKYQCLEITPAMLNKFNDLVYEAKASGYDDAWIMSNYEDYLVNEERVMDYYTEYQGLWYEPIGIFIHGGYQINGVQGDQNVLNKQVGESNQIGNTYGVCQIAGQTVSRQEYDTAKKNGTTQDLIDISVHLDYKMIKPDININCTPTILEKGETAYASVLTHYSNPNNKTFPDFTLPNYPLTLPYHLKHFSTDVDELTTNASGRGEFQITALEEGVEFIKVMFYVEGYFGEYSANFLKVKCGGDFTISGHIEQTWSGSFRYSDIMQEALDEAVSLTSVGSFTITTKYEFKGMLDLGEDGTTCSGMIEFFNLELEFSCTDAVYEGWGDDGQYARIKLSHPDDEFISVAFGTYNFSGTVDELNACNISTNQSKIFGACIVWDNQNEFVSADGETFEWDLPMMSIIVLINNPALLLEFDLKEGVDFANSSSLKDMILDDAESLKYLYSLSPELSSAEMEEMITFFETNTNSKSTTQEVEVIDNREEAQED